MAETPLPFDTLSDDQLLAETKRLVAAERRATAAFLQSLMEVDARRLFLREGCASLFTYCTRVLHLAEGAAYNRIEAARAARRYPVVLDALANGAITLTAARLLAPHLTEGNHRELLEAASHKSKRDLEVLIAALRPKPPAPTVLRRVPIRVETPPLIVPAAANTGTVLDALLTWGPSDVKGESRLLTTRDVSCSASPPNSQQRSPDRLRSKIDPLSPTDYRLQVTMRRETHDKLRRAQDLLRHAVPSGDVAEILDRALTLLVADLERRRCAETNRPHKAVTEPARRSRHIPASVKRAVWRRDQGRCAFVESSGRCQETSFLEFHHVEPYATGGGATIENIQLRCRAHNLYEATLLFGDGGDHVRECTTEWWRGDSLISMVASATG